MRWVYEIHWKSGTIEPIPSSKLTIPGRTDLNLVIYTYPHGHDSRFDYMVIPLSGVDYYEIREVQ